jgi:hypothetical protein
MKYVLISDLENPEEFHDGLYGARTRNTPDSDEPVVIEVFSENDLYTIRNFSPPEADALALMDDWMYWNSKANMFYGYVFKKE